MYLSTDQDIFLKLFSLDMQLQPSLHTGFELS